MALARNLKTTRSRKQKKLKLPKIKRFSLLLLLVAFIIGGYGLFNLTKLAPQKVEEVKYDSTGDKPLPQELVFWIKADGGLYMRAEPTTKSKIVKLIPDGTELKAIEVKEDWYKTSYQNKEGWVNKSFTTLEAPKEDQKKTWNTYSNKEFGYSLMYPKEWVVQDYGPNPASASLSYVAFGSQLGATLDPVNLPPVIVRVSPKAKDTLEAVYKTYSGAVFSPEVVSGLPATKFTYNSASGTQMTAYLIPKASKTYIIEETGGFQSEITEIAGSLNLK